MRTVTYAFHMQAWKRGFLQRYFPDRAFVFVPLFLTDSRLQRDWLNRIEPASRPEFFVWGLNLPETARSFAARHGLVVTMVEDGFIRSAVPHAGRTPPLSLTLDRQTAYFDSRTPSDLETILETHDFSQDGRLMIEAREGLERLLTLGISKYNAPVSAAAPVYGEKRKRRVLAIGQVDGDASIRFGCPVPVTNEEMVRIAVAENPDAEVIYKPHPDVLNGVRSSSANLEDLSRICTVLTSPVPLARAFETIDEVYAITSLAGFEALLRGLPVTVLGLPFYAGWGLTNDRQSTPRRTRRLTVEELFAGAYLLYSRYFRPETGDAISFDTVIRELRRPVAPAYAEHGSPDRRIYGLLGWRRCLTPMVAAVVRGVGTAEDADYYRHFPVDFFRERPERALRMMGRILYPLDERPMT
jgi:capsule polysaccharide export protein KpsC/LpsZ